MTINLKLLF